MKRKRQLNLGVFRKATSPAVCPIIQKASTPYPSETFIDPEDNLGFIDPEDNKFITDIN